MDFGTEKEIRRSLRSGGLPRQATDAIAHAIGQLTLTGNTGAGTPASLAGMLVSEEGNPFFHTTVFTFTDVSIDLTDTEGEGQAGSIPIYTFPEGAVVVDLTVFNNFTVDGYASLVDTFEVLVGVSPTAVEVFGTMQATVTTTAVDEVATFTFGVADGNGKLSASDSTSSLHLGVEVADDAAHGSGTVVVNGTMKVVWYGVPTGS